MPFIHPRMIELAHVSPQAALILGKVGCGWGAPLPVLGAAGQWQQRPPRCTAPPLLQAHVPVMFQMVPQRRLGQPRHAAGRGAHQNICASCRTHALRVKGWAEVLGEEHTGKEHTPSSGQL